MEVKQWGSVMPEITSFCKKITKKERIKVLDILSKYFTDAELKVRYPNLLKKETG